MTAASLLITYAGDLHLPFKIPSWNRILYSLDKSSPDLGGYPVKVHFLDVGQGDCAFIETGGHAILIDGGERGNADKIKSYIYSAGFDKIDLMIATHPHSDHMGGLVGILESVPVKEILMSELDEFNTPTTKVYEDFLDAAADSGAKVTAAKPGLKYRFGEASLTVLSPSSQDSDLNNMSVVTRLEYGDIGYLFMGDATSKVEKQLLGRDEDVSANVIKLGHHGSKHSSSSDFIVQVAPELAVFCVGYNTYGHPTQDVIDILEKYYIEYRRTDYNGDIVVATDGKRIEVN